MNAIKVVSMRLRGAKAELEDAGEETDGLVESTSKLQEKIKALTGVDIMIDDSTFKSTYEILLEISQVWDDLSDVSRANVLEVIAGKTRGSVVAGLLQQGDTLESAYQDSQGAEGSALKENERYLESIQGHLDKLSNQWQKIWVSDLTRETMNWFVDKLTGLLKIVEKIGIVWTTVITAGIITAGKALVKTYASGGIFKSITGYFSGITTGQQALQAAVNGTFVSSNIDEYIKSLDGLSLAQQRAAIMSSTLSETEKKEMLARIENTAVTKANTSANIENSASDIADATANATSAASTDMDTGATIENIAATKASTSANIENAASASSEALSKTKGIGAGIVQLASAHPAITTILGIGAALMAVVGVVKYNKKKQKEAAEEITKAYEEAKNEIDEINQSFENTKSTTKEISQEYAELAQGVNLLTNENKNLSTENYDRFLDLSNQLAELYPSLTKSFDENGNAILNLSGDVNTITGSLNKLIEAEDRLAKQKILNEMSDLYGGQKQNIDKYTEKKKKAQEKQKNAIKAQEFLNNLSASDRWYADGTSVNGGLSTGEISKMLIKAGYDPNDFVFQYSEDNPNLLELASWDILPVMQKINEARAEVEIASQELEAEINNVKQDLHTWLTVDSVSYGNIQDSNLQLAVQGLINNIQWDSVPDSSKEKWESLVTYLEEQIVYNVSKVNDKKITNALSEVFSNAELTPEEKLDYIQQIQDYFGEGHAVTLFLNPIFGETETLQNQYDDAIGRFKKEDSELLKKYKEEIDNRRRIYSSSNYVGNVDINQRPIVIDENLGDDYQTTYTGFQEYWKGDEETGHYEIIHFTPILPDGTVLDDTTLYDYLDNVIAKADNALEADNPENGGLGILYKIDTEVNGNNITDKNLEEAFSVADAWDNEMHEKQASIYGKEADALIAYNNALKDQNKIKEFFEDESINTSEEIEYWNRVTEGITDADEAIEAYKTAKEKDKVSFIDLLNEDEYKDIKKELLELAKSGEITEETLESTEEYNKLLDKTETSARAAKNQILDMLNTQEKLAGVSQGIGSLKSAYEEFKDEDIGFVTAETLESLPEVFKNMNDGRDFDLFSKIVGDPTRTTEQMQNAFNDLVTAYVNDQRLFSNITEASDSEINSLIANLKQKGITNAEEVVNNAKKNATTASYLINEVETEYAAYLSNKDGYDEEYFNSVVQKNSTLINELGGSYKTDYDNWCELLTKKAEAYNEFVNAINASGMFNTTSAASKYYTEDPGAAYLTAKQYLEEAQAYEKAKIEASKPGNTSSHIAMDVFGDKKYTEEGIIKAQTYIAQYEATQAAYEKLNLNLTTVSTNFGKPLNFDGSDKDDSSEPEDIDWIETLLNNTSEALDKVKDKVDDTYSTWEERNKSLQKAITDTRNAMALQAQAEATYLAKANSIALPEYYKTLVRNGNMSIQDNVDENTSKLISEYKEWYDKAKACGEAQDELNESLKELETISKMDLVEGKYDALYSKLDNSIDTIQSKIDKAELQGMFANENYYSSMIGYTQSKINNLRKERAELSNIMNMSGVQSNTEAWNEMYQKLMDVDSEILTLENDIIGFNNDIRNLNWEIFEYLEESISRITDESQYLIDLIAHEDLFDKDTGKFTEYADATLGLHAVNYDTHKQQVQDYYEEVQELQRQLVNGAGQEVLEQYNKMVDAHQDAVLAAEDEKQAMLDLIEEGYNAQLEAIQKIIDKKKEQMNQEKDLYDYQKSIAEKTKNIASLEKQKLAYEGDDSEEGMSRIQQIKVELEEAKADLEQTEYEKYLDDSQRMLDELTQDYEDWINERLDDEDTLLKEIVSGISDKGDAINETLQRVANENGTFISSSITSIFDANSPFTSELSSIKTNTAGTTNAINDLINKVVGITGAQTKGNAGGTSGSNGNSNGSSNAGGGSNKTPSTSSTPTTPSTPNNTNANKNTSNNSSKGEYDGIFIYKKYSPQQLNTNTSLVDRLKSKNIDASWEARAKYWSKIFGGAYTGSESQNVKFLNWLKSNGYKSGTSSAKKGLHWTQENGEELIIRKSDGALLTPLGNGDMVFNNESSKRLWELSQNPEKYLANMSMPQLSVDIPNYSGLAAKGNVSQTMEVRIDGISIELPGITNYEEFRSKFIKDGVIMDAIFTSVNNKVMNKNPLTHLQYSRRR